MQGRLTLVGTPIGNLSDFSPRALETLRECDVIAAEDTRVTLRLLNHFGIKKPLISYFEHNKREKGEQLCARMEAGEHIVLVSDAGMPAISDPGEDLVCLCREKGISVGCVPGPSAVITALALSGMPAGRFTFEGFLSVSKRSRREHLQAIKTEPRTMIFYEAPHKLPYTLADLLEALGDRPLALCRELTKLHEEVITTTLAQATARFREEVPRGEFVLIVGGAPAQETTPATLEDAVSIAQSYMNEGMSISEAAKRAAAETKIKKSEIYRLLAEG